MNKHLKSGLIGLGVLVIVFSAFIAYAYYFNPRIYTLCCIGEEFTNEFVDREFLVRFTTDGGFFGGSSSIIEIHGDGTFEKTTVPRLSIQKESIKKGRLNRDQMKILVNRIEDSNFFDFPKEIKNMDCFDAPGTSLTISLDDKYHSVSEYCSFMGDVEYGNGYWNLASLVNEFMGKSK